jgi:uncharacterized protein (DUF433 family)
MSARKAALRRPTAETPISVRLEESLLDTIRTQSERTGKPISRVIRELLDTALRMQRFPGITFIEGPAGRRAHLAGTGLDVWEVIELLREFDSASAIREHFPRLSPMSIQVAQAYAKAYPQEIDAFLRLNKRTPEQLKREVPWLETVRQ